MSDTTTIHAVLRWSIPIEDRPYAITAAGKIGSHIEAHGPSALSFWTIPSSAAPRERFFQVFGTGQPVPPDFTYIGTAPRTSQGFVWHLFEWIKP